MSTWTPRDGIRVRERSWLAPVPVALLVSVPSLEMAMGACSPRSLLAARVPWSVCEAS